MVAAAFTGGVTVKQGSGASPQVWTLIEEANTLGGLGTTNPIIDVTSFDSASREYIAGLGDGSELSIECNRIQTAGNQQDVLVANVEAQATKAFQVVLTDASTSPNTVKTYEFNAVCLSWTVTPSVDDKHTITFTVKITGAISLL